MSNAQVASETEIKTFIQKYPEWKFDQTKNIIMRSYALKSYFKGLSLVQMIGWLAQKNNHHPDITLTFSEVKVTLTTHDVGNKVSSLDLKMAELIEGSNF